MDKNKIHGDIDKRQVIVRGVKAAIFVAFYIFFWCHSEFYTQISEASGVTTTDFFKKRIVIVTVLFAVGIVISFREIKLSDKWNKWVLIAMVVLTPVVNFLALEYVNIRKSRVVFEVFKGIGAKKSIATLLILMMIMLGIYIISNRLKVAAIGISVIVVLFGMLCHYVFLFRGIPFLASDFSTASAAISVMGNYEYKATYQLFILVLVSLVWCVLIASMKNEKGFKWKIRVGAAIAYVIIMTMSINTLVHTKFLLDKMNVTLNTFQPQKSYGNNGAILTAIRSVQLIVVEKPEGYSVKASEEIAAQYPEKVVENAVKPNVIVIMNEAFSDLQAINDFKTNKEVLPYFRGLKENVVRGEMYVSSYGGKTANTEFEFLTGCSQAFSPPSATPYQLFIKDKLPSLTWKLKADGYQGNIAMHPYSPMGYNRKKVYPLLGFDEFFSVEEFKEVKQIRNYVSDEAMYDRIIEEYESAKKTSEAPFYTFNVTMQNHTSYAKDFDNLPKDIEILDERFKNPEVERYLNLVHISDMQLERLITYFEAQEEPTIVVFFGDHQPKLPDSFYKELLGKANDKLTDEELMEKYKTPFIIWANYDIDEKENIKTSTNYLSSLVLESCKMQTTRWGSFLAETAKEMPVINIIGHFGKDGKYYDNKDETSPYYESLNKYQILQYNDMFDKGKRIENFFE